MLCCFFPSYLRMLEFSHGGRMRGNEVVISRPHHRIVLLNDVVVPKEVSVHHVEAVSVLSPRRRPVVLPAFRISQQKILKLQFISMKENLSFSPMTFAIGLAKPVNKSRPALSY